MWETGQSLLALDLGSPSFHMMGAGTARGCRVINLQCKHCTLFPFAGRLKFRRQGSIGFFDVFNSTLLDQCSLCSIFLGWLGFLSQGKLTSKHTSLGLILRLWDVFLNICSKNALFVTKVLSRFPRSEPWLGLAVCWCFRKLCSAWAERAGADWMTPCSVESWFFKWNAEADCLLYQQWIRLA